MNDHNVQNITNNTFFISIGVSGYSGFSACSQYRSGIYESAVSTEKIG